MSKRLSPIPLLAAAGLATALLVSGCTPTPAPTPTATTSHSTTPSATPTATTPPTPTGTPTAAGCAATSATMPAGAVTHATIDVDGLPDTEWISDTPTLEFGVTTASGATYSFPLSTASPAPRQGFIARLNDHRIVAMVDDNRSAVVFFFVNCGWVEPKDSHGAQVVLDYNDFANHGSGVGCSLGYVVQFQATMTGSTYTVTKQPLNLNTTGSYATLGPPVTVGTGLAASSSTVKVAQELSCEAVTVTSGGVEFGE